MATLVLDSPGLGRPKAGMPEGRAGTLTAVPRLRIRPAMPPLCCGWLPVMRPGFNYL